MAERIQPAASGRLSSLLRLKGSEIGFTQLPVPVVVLAAATIVAVSLVVASLYAVARLRREHTPTYHVHGHKASTNLKEIVETQWKKNPNAKYILQLPFRQIYVLPKDYVSDYSWKQEHEISSNIDLRERLLGRWTLLGSMTPEAPGDRTHSAIAFIKGDMTKRMGDFFHDVHAEIKASIEREIGACNTWTPHSSYWVSVRLNLHVFERVFVGLDLCRDAEWNEACVGYSTSAIMTASTLMKWPWVLRPVVAPFLPETKNLKKHIIALQRFVQPVLQARLRAAQHADFKRPNDFIQWWVDNNRHPKQADAYALTCALIQLNIAGIQSTGMVLMQALFDVAGRHDYVEPLRDELLRVMAETGEDQLSPRSLAKLELMDSFLKESQRHVAQNILSIYRKVMAPLTLKDGTILPTGSYVCVPSMDPEADPKTLTRPFDGFRWATMRRQQPGGGGSSRGDTRHLSVATTPESLEFGHGAHACPGRFFATNVVKATLAAVLLKYELRFPPGQGNPAPKYNKILVLTPDREQAIEFRLRQ